MIRTKAATTVEELGDRYVLMGPLNEVCMRTEVDIVEPACEPLKRAIGKLREHDINVIFLLILQISRWCLAVGLLKVIHTFSYLTLVRLHGA